MASYGGNLHSSTLLERSETEPTSPTVGLIWQKISTGEIKIFDGTVFTIIADVQSRGLAILGL